MPESTSNAALLALVIETRDSIPAYAQLYQRFREMILAGTFAANERLPSTRTLATDLGLSRTTVNAAYDQLASEGYIQSKRGAGSFVTDLPPDQLLLVKKPEAVRDSGLQHANLQKKNAERGRAEKPLAHPFQPHAVAFDQFPHAVWARLLSQTWRTPSADLLWRADPFGHFPLRAAICEHLRAWRGISCVPEQIIITCGAGDALDIILRAIGREKDQVWIEDPGFAVLYNSVAANGYVPVPIPVEENGLDIEEAIKRSANACAAIVTPSRQFPLGMTMSLSRRLALLDWAQKRDSWIIEDDFDSEYRFSGQPLSPLMALDESDCVIYLGSFSKVMLRSLRLGYIVCPQPNIGQIRSVLERHGAKASLIAQPALAQFISSGEFAAYIRKTRRLYAKRLRHLQDALQENLGQELIIRKQTGGLHLVAEFSDDLARRTCDIDLSAKARQSGIFVPALSEYYRGAQKRDGLLIGFAGFDEVAITAGVEKLAKILRT